MNLYADILPDSGVTAKQQMQWQEHLSNTAHQRQMADLKASGLNPWLADTSGASVPSGSVDSAETLKLIRGIVDSSSYGAGVSAKAVKDATKYVAKAVKDVSKEFAKSFEALPGVQWAKNAQSAKERAYESGKKTIQDAADFASMIPVIGSSIAKPFKAGNRIAERNRDKIGVSNYMSPDQEEAYIERVYNNSSHSARDSLSDKNEKLLRFLRKVFQAFGSQ